MKEVKEKLNLRNLVTLLLALGALISLAFGINSHFEKRYALSSNLEAISCNVKSDIKVVSSDINFVENRLDYKIETDILNQSRRDLRDLEEKHGSDPDKVKDGQVRKEMKELKDFIEDQKTKVKTLQDKILNKN